MSVSEEHCRIVEGCSGRASAQRLIGHGGTGGEIDDGLKERAEQLVSHNRAEKRL